MSDTLKGEVLTRHMDVLDTQEKLVRINLHIKHLTYNFTDCVTEAFMENLNTAIRHEFDNMRLLIDNLRELAALQENPESKSMLAKDVVNHEQQLATCQNAFRKANRKCIQDLEDHSRYQLFHRRDDEEELLFTALKKRKEPDQRYLLMDSGRTTDELTSMSRLLADTVRRSALTVDELALSSQTVMENRDETRSMGAVIGQSRNLLTKYGRREITDKVLIFFATAFFFACSFYILRKRVFRHVDSIGCVWNFCCSLVNLLTGFWYT